MLTQLIGSVGVGDRVVVNTTAVELGLGTGGWHVVHWNLEREAWSESRRAGQRHEAALHEPAGRRRPRRARRNVATIDGMPVSWPACTVSSRRSRSRSSSAVPTRGSSYVMTDGGALPIAISELVAAAPRPESDRRDDHVRARVRRRLRSGLALRGPGDRARDRTKPTSRSSRWVRAVRDRRPGSGSAASRSAPRSTPPRDCSGVPIAALRGIVRRHPAAPPRRFAPQHSPR